MAFCSSLFSQTSQWENQAMKHTKRSYAVGGWMGGWYCVVKKSMDRKLKGILLMMIWEDENSSTKNLKFSKNPQLYLSNKQVFIRWEE